MRLCTELEGSEVAACSLLIADEAAYESGDVDAMELHLLVSDGYWRKRQSNGKNRFHYSLHTALDMSHANPHGHHRPHGCRMPTLTCPAAIKDEYLGLKRAHIRQPTQGHINM